MHGSEDPPLQSQGARLRRRALQVGVGLWADAEEQVSAEVCARAEAGPEVGAGAGDGDAGSVVLAGVIANGAGDFAGVAHRVKRGFGEGRAAAKLFEDFGDGGFFGDASDGAATEHLLDGV